MKILNNRHLVFFFIAVNLFLNILGNNWGLPSRWHGDEKVANVLHMADEKTLIDPTGEFVSPTGYQLFLLASFIPVYAYLKLINFPLDLLKQTASISWDQMAKSFPGFATWIYIYARILSGLIGALTVYLVYLLAKELYDEKAGLFSAAFLSVCMGFIGVNHFAKYQSLLNFMVVLALFLCLKALGKENLESSNKYVNLSFLSAGFATSVHINAPLLLLPLFLTFIFINFKAYNNYKRLIFMLSGCIFLYIAGIIIGTPTLLTNFNDYLIRSGGRYEIILGNKHITERLSLFVGPLNYFLKILSIFGIPISILIFWGIIRPILFWKNISKKEVVILSFIFCYYFIITVLNKSKYPEVKSIIVIVPLLTVFAGKSMADMFRSKKIVNVAKYLVFPFIFIYSLAYSIKADLHFIKGDPRYASTQWIIQNIPKGSRIEVFNQLHYVADPGIMDDYEIMYLGRSSKDFRGKRFFKWNTVENREAYLTHINKYDSSADYIIIDIDPDDIAELYKPVYAESPLPGREEYIKLLFENKKNFRLVKVIRPKNRKIKSNKIQGLVYFENLWWDPIPSYEDTAVTSCIFKRITK